MKPHLTLRQFNRAVCRSTVTILAGLVTIAGALGLSSYEAKAETYEDIALTEENFPNAYGYLTNQNSDLNHDGILSYEERSNVTTLEVLDYNLSELSAFPNLSDLTIDYLTNDTASFSSFNKLTNLTIQDGVLKEINYTQLGSVQNFSCHCPTLETVNLSYGSTKEMDLSDCINLNLFKCSVPSLSKLNLSGCSNLEVFESIRTCLDAQTVSDLTNLRRLVFAQESDSDYGRYGYKPADYLDLSKLTKLEYLYCDGFNAINLSNCTELTYLNCSVWPGSARGVSVLDISNCKKLETLYTNSSNLKELDVSGLTELKTLGCTISDSFLMKNSLNIIGLSDCTQLISLNCEGRLMTELDLSGAYVLTELYCSGNKLKTLDLSSCSNLPSLSCAGNSLDTIIFPENNVLGYIFCQNQTDNSWAVDFSNCVNLVHLECSSCNIKNLNSTLPQNLQYLDCSNNSLTNLDLSVFPGLVNLNCSNNNLTELNLSVLPDLQILNCSNNNLTELYLSSCNTLTSLTCSNNNLSALDASSLSSVKNIICSYNKLTDFKLPSIDEINWVDCSNNELVSLDFSNCSGDTFTCSNNKLIDLEYDPAKWNTVQYEGNPYWDENFAEESIEVSITNFPDDDIYKIALYADADYDGFLSRAERNTVTNVSYINSYNNLQGLKYFPKIEVLTCNIHDMGTIDLSRLKHLKRLSLYGQNIPLEIDLSNLHELEHVEIYNNSSYMDSKVLLPDYCPAEYVELYCFDPDNVQIKYSGIESPDTEVCDHATQYLTLIRGSDFINRCSNCGCLVNHKCTHEVTREEIRTYEDEDGYYINIYCANCGIYMGKKYPPVSVAQGTAGPSITWEINDDTLTLSGEGTMEALSLATDDEEKAPDWDVDLFSLEETEENNQTMRLSAQAPMRMSRSVSLLSAAPAPAAEISPLAEPLAQSDDELASLLATVKHIVIGEGITNICDHAFVQCTAAETVSIPETVTTIGDYAFAETELAEVVIPDSVTEIGSYAFAGTEIAELTIPESVITIGSYAFAGTEITELTIPESVTTIGDHAFEDTNLTEVIIPETVTEIGENAFVGVTIFAEEGSTGAQYAEENETTSFTPIACAEGHQVNEAVTENYIEATCTTDGSYDEVSYCQVCGMEIARVTKVIKGEHSIVEDSEVKASCTTDGLTAGSHCSVCGTVLVAREVIKALGHDFHNGECEVCGELEIIPLAGPQITAFELNNNTLTFKWDKVSGAKSYVIYKKAEGSEPVAIATLKGKATSYTVNNYANNADCTFGVSVVLPSEESTISYCEMPSDYLPAPTVSAKKASNAIKLSWKQIPTAESYRIYRSTNGKDWTELAEVSGDTLSFSDQTAQAKTTYYYAVAACKGEFVSDLKASSKIKR